MVRFVLFEPHVSFYFWHVSFWRRCTLRFADYRRSTERPYCLMKSGKFTFRPITLLAINIIRIMWRASSVLLVKLPTITYKRIGNIYRLLRFFNCAGLPRFILWEGFPEYRYDMIPSFVIVLSSILISFKFSFSEPYEHPKILFSREPDAESEG